MSDIDISLLYRLVQSASAGNPELEAVIAPLMAAANSDGVPNEEDLVLSDAEIQTYVSRVREESRTNLSILTRNRDELAGSLSAARTRLETAHASPGVLQLVELAASQDGGARCELDMSALEAIAVAMGTGASEAAMQRLQAIATNLAAGICISSEEIAALRRDLGEELASDEAISAQLDAAAEQARLWEELSAEEIELVVNELTESNDHAQQLNAETLVGEVNTLLSHLRAMELEVPEAFFPESEEARRAPIDLNFLKHLPPPSFAGEDEQSLMLLTLTQIAGIDINDRNAEWSMSYEELETFIAALPEEARADFPNAEIAMANFRFLALTLREQINGIIGENIAAGGEATESGVSIRDLSERRSQIHDPRVDQIFDIAGEDGVLTTLDVERHLQRTEAENPGFLQGMLGEAPPPEADAEPQTDLQRAIALYLAGARALVADYVSEAAVPAEAPGARPFDRNLYISRQVLGDLERMRAGFTHRENQYVEESSLVGTIDFISWACTLGGALTWIGAGDPPRQTEEGIAEFGEDILPRLGPTYRHVVRGFVEMHDRERGEALQELRRLLENPPSDFTGERTIPNALEYFRTHDDDLLPGRNARYHELLTDEVYQADRLWRIRTESDPRRAEAMWFSLAEDLREGLTSWWSTGTYGEGVRNLDFARAILHALHRESTDEATRNRAHHLMQDSGGMDITDDEGNVIEEGGGEFGLWPPDWFRNFSDENVDGATSDAVLLVASLGIGGGGFAVGRSAMTVTGRTAIGAGLLRFLGMRATGTVLTAGAETAAAEATVASTGWFGRHMASWAARRVATAEAAVANATTEAEIAAARQALIRTQGVQRVLTSPTMISAAAETVAPNATGWLGRVAAAHPPVAEALVNRAAGTGTRALMARATIATLENISLRGVGRGLRWMSYEGIVSYGIAGYVFQNYPRHSNHPGIFDREYELSLPAGEAPEARAPSRPATGTHARGIRRPRGGARTRRPNPSAAAATVLPPRDAGRPRGTAVEEDHP